MPLDWGWAKRLQGGGGGWLEEMDALDCSCHSMPHTRGAHTHLACVLCLYEVQNMHKSCAENLYLHFVLPVLFNNIWSANGWVGEGSGKRNKRKRNSQAVEILRFLYRMLPLLASPLPSLFVRLRKFCIFPLCTCFSAAREAEGGGGANCNCKLFVLFQVPNNLTTKILNFCLNCRQCVLQLCVRRVCVCSSGCVSSH